jgi:hypothetical protein
LPNENSSATALGGAACAERRRGKVCRVGAHGVTHRAVRCSAWLGDVGWMARSATK